MTTVIEMDYNILKVIQGVSCVFHRRNIWVKYLYGRMHHIVLIAMGRCYEFIMLVTVTVKPERCPFVYLCMFLLNTSYIVYTTTV